MVSIIEFLQEVQNFLQPLFFYYYLRTNMFIRKIILSLLVLPIAALAWEPTKPVQVYIGNTPGAGNEMAFRKLAEIVQKKKIGRAHV